MDGGNVMGRQQMLEAEEPSSSTSSVSQETRLGRRQQQLEEGLSIRSPPIKDIILFGCHVLKIKG